MFRTLFLFFVLLSIVNQGVASTFGKISDVGQFALPAAAIVTTMIHEDKKGFLQFGETFGSTMGIVYILKPTVNETRPNGGRWSFPSGHTAAAFSSAMYLQRRYGWKYGVPSFAVAGLVGYGRVQSHMHWAQDVVAGGAIGMAMGFIFTKKYDITVTPMVDSKTVGVVITKQIE